MESSLTTILVVIVAVSFVAMTLGVIRSVRQLRRYRQDVVTRMKALRIHQMLPHAGVTPERFLRKASPVAVEKHLIVCKHCTTIDTCDDYLKNDKDIPEHTFCPNFRDLSRYR
jgi:hypothetical protein